MITRIRRMAYVYNAFSRAVFSFDYLPFLRSAISMVRAGIRSIAISTG